MSNIPKMGHLPTPVNDTSSPFQLRWRFGWSRAIGQTCLGGDLIKTDSWQLCPGRWCPFWREWCKRFSISWLSRAAWGTSVWAPDFGVWWSSRWSSCQLALKTTALLRSGPSTVPLCQRRFGPVATGARTAQGGTRDKGKVSPRVDLRISFGIRTSASKSVCRVLLDL